VLTPRAGFLYYFFHIMNHMGPQDSFNEFLAKKAYEISYAVFRLKGVLEPKQELGVVLEANASRLLEEAVRGDMNAASRHIRVLEYLLRLGGDTGVFNPNHVNMVISELARLEADIATQQFNLQVNLQNDIQSAIQTTNQSASQSAIEDYGPESEVIIDENLNEYAEERRETILQFILQSGPNGCRFKDIFDGLRDKLQAVGERTIRYDLQELAERGIIEKYGPGGAHTYYRAKA
jgi:hypothetical protein